jgi:hypothetical protein
MGTEIKPDTLFLLSVDTEEEWDWSGQFPQQDFSVSNTDKIPEFQQFCKLQGIRPTYFVDYAVANDSKSVALIKPIIDNNKGEIGAHLHPWCNPPFFGFSGEKESHVVNLPFSHVEQKLESLILILKERFSISPSAFRTGRWGINGEVLSLLERKGFEIDSSMYPFFKNEYFNCEETCLMPYWPDYESPMHKGNQRNILEFPVTVGFNHQNYKTMIKLYNLLNKPSLQPLRPVGIAWHTRLMRKLYFSPEVTSGKDMKPLIDFTLNNHHPVLHMYLHSSSLLDNSTGLMTGRNSMQKICSNISEVIEYAKTKTNLKFCTISEAATLIKNRTGILGE